MIKNGLSISILLLLIAPFCWAQDVQIDNYSVSNIGQVQLEIQAEAGKYYLLHTQHEPTQTYESITSMTMGVDGSLIITEPGAAYDLENYRITAHDIDSPVDTDGDGKDDVSEFNNMPTDAPFNFAAPIAFNDGATSIDNAETFESLAVTEDVPWAPFLNGQQFVKFGILDLDTDEPKLYFINSSTHFIHANFFDAIGAQVFGDDGSGEIVYNPNEISPNGVVGSYKFNFSFGEARNFEETQKTFELLLANMPFLQNNMQHFIGNVGENDYNTNHKQDYEGSRIEVVLESEYFSEIDYIPFNNAEGYGFFRVMEVDEDPGSRDIVLYDALPNSLPRVGGIITSVVQTPLSHVNLRAIQDNVPNAYIRNPLSIDSIANLVGKYIYYKADDENYEIREASLEEVNAWYENIRPKEDQTPVRDLSFTEILPLDSIGFEMSTSFGAKCSNVATMRKFGFPEGTIPNGFGVPFYFYDEFMKYNNFYEAAEEMINKPGFVNDLDTRIDMLKDFRKEIKDAPMPQWMLDQLQVMHDAFPEGTSVRCRSSTNNEDLPGFSGAGLYTSKTQHPWEGHISKSIKQVYASMWNFRAFDERDFYRINHFVAAMGVLCHPNFKDEKSNGVGISIDPLYGTQNTFYLNTQVGESLITNPEANSIPEEMLLYQNADQGYLLLRESNLVESGELVMDEVYLDQMREYLQVIHDEFAILYNVEGVEGFGMDIEYKVTVDDQLAIKQARPWVSFWADINGSYDLGVIDLVAPQSSASLGDSELVTVKVENAGFYDMDDFELSLYVEGQLVETLNIADTIKPFRDAEYQFSVAQDFSQVADYNIMAIVKDSIDGYQNNDTLNVVLSKLYVLEGGIEIEEAVAQCGAEVEVKAILTNYGESTFNNAEIQVIVNGMVVDTFINNSSISYQDMQSVNILVNENLEETDNEIILNLLKINDEQDAIADNNTASITTDLVSNFDYVTLIINMDDYPQETSWELYEQNTQEIIASASSISSGTQVVEENVCVDYNSCYVFKVIDSFGDGICCGYGEGSFLVLNADGDTLAINNGQFNFSAEELFCPNTDECNLSAEIITTPATGQFEADGVIIINPAAGTAPYRYSINGGNTFGDDNMFTGLLAGEYNIVVRDSTGLCQHEETVVLEYDVPDNVVELSNNQIKVYPNPTYDLINIQLEYDTDLSGELIIEVYDYLGRRVQTNTIGLSGNSLNTNISLKEHSTGTYIIKCYNDQFEKYISVLKM